MDIIPMIIKDCPYCNHNTPYGNYCIFCGEVIPKTIMDCEVIKCKECNSTTVIGANYCVACGTKLK